MEKTIVTQATDFTFVLNTDRSNTIKAAIIPQITSNLIKKKRRSFNLYNQKKLKSFIDFQFYFLEF